MTLFGNDPVYRRFLALHPGIWPEVGVLEDAPLLRALRRDRTSLGLPFDRWIPPRRVRRDRKAAS
jgi:hypothetical protein